MENYGETEENQGAQSEIQKEPNDKAQALIANQGVQGTTNND